MTVGLRYSISLPDPASHLAHVTVRADLPPGATEVELSMPAWCPGSYLVRDYARFVRDLEATVDGAPVVATKIDKGTWRIASRGGVALELRYAIYGNELTVRTNHIDADHALLHTPAVLLGGAPWRDQAASVELQLPPGWEVATGLRADGPNRYLAANLDELYDMPLHLAAPGQATRTTFTAAGVPVELVLWGARTAGGQFTEADLIRDLGKIVDGHAGRMGEVPFDRYVFVVMFTHDGYGGLEHRNSSINIHNTYGLATRKHYEGLLELLSHELFHAWNGKRLAPPALLDFDYSREAYTRCLWVMEGMTSHYDRWNLRTSGVITGKSLLEKVLDDWTRLVMVPGRRRHSLEASSFDAWIKLYKPDESNLNTTVSYYLKGGLVMFTLDLAIRRQSNGARSLDDVLRALWRDYGARGVPHPENVEPDFRAALGDGVDVGDVFERQIRGVADPDLAAELRHIGLTLRPGREGDAAQAPVPPWLGVTTTGNRVTGVFDDGPAAAAGLSPGDELIAIDGLRATSLDDARALVAARRPGDVVELTVFRRQVLRRLALTIGVAPAPRWELAVEPGVDETAAARFAAWLGEPLPPPGVVVGINLGTRTL